MKDSRNILKIALKDCDREAVAKVMTIAVGSLNNQVAGELPYRPKGDTMNFIERTMAFLEEVESQTGNRILLEWMAQEFGCLLVCNPAIRAAKSPAITKVSEILRDFAGVVDEIGKATADQIIERHEAEHIRAKWEIMKRVTEEFVLAAETGLYDKHTTNPEN